MISKYLVFHFIVMRVYSSDLTNSRFYSVVKVFAAAQHNQAQGIPPVDGQPARKAQALVFNPAASMNGTKEKLTQEP